MTINAGNLKKGDFIKYQDSIFHVQKAEFYSPGKGSALMKTKIKNLSTGKTIDVTFKSNESLEIIEVNALEVEYLYRNNNQLVFIDRNYNQFEINTHLVGEVANFLKEGVRVFLYLYEDKPITIKPPQSVKLKVVKTEIGIKGDTVSSAKKPAQLETGITIQVPLFIKEGEEIIVNPETGEYVGRA